MTTNPQTNNRKGAIAEYPDTAETDALIEQLRLLRQDYMFDFASSNISQNSLALLIAPAATGKSTIADRVGQQPDFNHVQSFTTRAPRPDDRQDSLDYVPHTPEGLQSILDSVLRREIVQYIIHPTTNRVYGTNAKQFDSPYSIAEMLAGEVENIRQLPFKRSWAFFLTVEPDQWIERMIGRYGDQASQERTKRLDEAVFSLQWGLAQAQTADSDLVWIDNSNGQLKGAAKQITEVTRDLAATTKPSFNGVKTARAMLVAAQKLLQQ